MFPTWAGENKAQYLPSKKLSRSQIHDTTAPLNSSKTRTDKFRNRYRRNVMSTKTDRKQGTTTERDEQRSADQKDQGKNQYRQEHGGSKEQHGKSGSQQEQGKSGQH